MGSKTRSRRMEKKRIEQGDGVWEFCVRASVLCFLLFSIYLTFVYFVWPSSRP